MKKLLGMAMVLAFFSSLASAQTDTAGKNTAAPAGNATVKQNADEEEAPVKKHKRRSADGDDEAQVPSKDKRVFVAIGKFENKTDATPNQFETLRERISDSIINTRKFQVVERQQMNQVLSEQKLQSSGMTKSGEVSINTPESGKLQSAGYVLYGTVLFMGQDNTSAQVAEVSAAKLTARVELQLRMASAETGKIISSKTITGTGVQSRMVSEGTSTKGNIEEQVLRDACQDTAKKVVDALMDLAYPAKVLAVGKNSVTVNLTKEQVELDDLYEVVSLGKELKDPDTGESLGQNEETIGRVRISSPGAKFSKAKPEGDLDIEDIEPGMILHRVSDAQLLKEQRSQKTKETRAFESRF